MRNKVFVAVREKRTSPESSRRRTGSVASTLDPPANPPPPVRPPFLLFLLPPFTYAYDPENASLCARATRTSYASSECQRRKYVSLFPVSLCRRFISKKSPLIFVRYQILLFPLYKYLPRFALERKATSLISLTSEKLESMAITRGSSTRLRGRG
ncbi:hypothetical protein PUN28_012570 [Cardiocondyla obscurior]|uniref:Uncharacterized protein n=1 Tax=Cardiocondyla obscurior TaxID=286306 RepID=A0AAW2FCB1_9HYME